MATNYELLSAARRVVEGALTLVPGERLIVIADEPRRELADAIVEAASWAKASCQRFELEAFGPAPLGELPKEIADALQQAQASVYVARGDVSEMPLRRQLVEAVATHELRHAHMLGLTARTMAAGLAVDPHRIADVARKLKARLGPSSEIRLKSAAGSDLVVRCAPAHRWVENSGIIRPGRWLNLPAGELLTAPAHVEGTFVADASVTEVPGLDGHPSSRAPVALTIDGRRVTAVSCSDRTLQAAVEAFLHGGANQARVGLVSFGTNIGLSEPTGALIVDQTLPGLHLALGMSLPALTGADWDSAGQLVLTGKGADVDIDGDVVLRSGRYLL